MFPAFSQSWEAVKSDRGYIYGEGWGSTVVEADKQALNDLISKIGVHVVGSVTHNETETTNNQGVETQSQFQSAVSTYSQATLNNTEKIILKNEPDAHVGRWIRRSEVNKIFESRKAKILDYVASAAKAEEQGKIDVALKDYYWALMLTKSLQYPDEMCCHTETGDKVVLNAWIPRQMNNIFASIQTSIIKREGDEVELLITYKKKPVNSIDYSYFDGRDWSNIYSAKDGIGVLELAPSNQSANYQLRFEYEYRGESRIDKDVENVLKMVASTPMRNAYQSVKSKVDSSRSVRQLQSLETASFSSVPQSVFQKPEQINDDGAFRSMIDKVVESITSKKYMGADHCFTPYAYDIYKRLIKYGKAKIVGTPNVSFYKSNEVVYARGLQMSFSFGGVRKSFIEDIVFMINKEAKIANISFGLGKTAEDDILGKGVWSESARFAIMDFLENYQTAYALKRLDYIERIFDDDAVIITGTVNHVPAKKIGTDDMQGMRFAHDIIRYNRHTKDSYLRQLKHSFDSKEFINLRFANNDVRKLGKGGEFYAIQISQEYYSSNYGDKGYLFLMVDINDPNKPIIKVRTWQPEKDPEFGLYGPGDFK